MIAVLQSALNHFPEKGQPYRVSIEKQDDSNSWTVFLWWEGNVAKVYVDSDLSSHYDLYDSSNPFPW